MFKGYLQKLQIYIHIFLLENRVSISVSVYLL